jgi:hypothetical protein
MNGGDTLLRDKTVIRASHDHSPPSSVVVTKASKFNVPPRLYDMVLKHEFAPALLHVISDFQSTTCLCKTVREVIVHYAYIESVYESDCTM